MRLSFYPSWYHTPGQRAEACGEFAHCYKALRVGLEVLFLVSCHDSLSLPFGSSLAAGARAARQGTPQCSPPARVCQV